MEKLLVDDCTNVLIEIYQNKLLVKIFLLYYPLGIRALLKTIATDKCNTYMNVPCLNFISAVCSITNYVPTDIYLILNVIWEMRNNNYYGS